ncbi:MAG: phosphoserine transaminase [Acidimicrobiia bacterium]|nr:phosphoserine transaminase [Acidimicrobiia bacterium]
MSSISIPRDILPADGRFGSGPSRVRTEALRSLAATGGTFMGTSHRKPGVRDVVGRIRTGMTSLFSLPDGYEVLLGNGGATAFWDAAAFGLIERRSLHATFGEFSSKFAGAVAAAPHLEDPVIVEASPGTCPVVTRADGVDVYALTHNETSTGVTMDVTRVADDGLIVVDATSAAGGIEVDPAAFDVYYFSPQKAFGGDGGLWVAICSPGAVSRIEAIGAGERYLPPFLSLPIALDNSRKDQTYNTPALATIFLLADSVDWMLGQGGLAWSVGRCAANAAALYSWADRSAYASPFVADTARRSPVTGTIDLSDAVAADDIATVLRHHGIIDIESYRKLGRNQLRIGLWPAIPVADVEALTASIDYVAARL